MSQPKASDGGCLPLTQFGQIVGACDRFEAEWRAGRRPRIERYLAEASEPCRSTLLRELLALELELRRGGGERPEPGEYRARLPEHSTVVDAAFEAQLGDGAPAEQPEANRPRADVDRGLLALQNNFTNRDASTPSSKGYLVHGGGSPGVGDVIDPTLVDHPAPDQETPGTLMPFGGTGALPPASPDPLGPRAGPHPLPDRATTSGRSEGSLAADSDIVACSDYLNQSWPQMSGPTSERADPTVRPPLPAAFEADYEVLAELGKGGMGEVLLVRHRRLKYERVIKLILPQLAHRAGFRERLERKAQAMARLRHPNAVTVHDVRTDGLPFIEMEYVRGQSLDKYLKEHSPLSLAQIAQLVRQLCDVLQYAHERVKIIHRDLKPANLMVEESDDPGELCIKVMDFGLVKPLDEATDLTVPGYPLGTGPYMSPEQWKDATAVDARADLFAVGVILYELLTGTRPFVGPSHFHYYEQICLEPTPPFKVRNPNAQVPPAIENLVLRCLEKDPSRRRARPASWPRSSSGSRVRRSRANPEREATAPGSAADGFSAEPPPSASAASRWPGGSARPPTSTRSSRSPPTS